MYIPWEKVLLAMPLLLEGNSIRSTSIEAEIKKRNVTNFDFRLQQTETLSPAKVQMKITPVQYAHVQMPRTYLKVWLQVEQTGGFSMALKIIPS